MKQALETMLQMQHRMNTRIHLDWVSQNFAWYRAIWIECGELIEHYGYKWWKKQSPDMAQVQLEVIDIWHFGMSALFAPDVAIGDIAARIEADFNGPDAAPPELREATEALALHALETRSFSPARFHALMLAAGLDFETLYTRYVGKNVLNFFRQDNGYQEGTYRKQWNGREDNEHLVDLLQSIESRGEDYFERLYTALEARYRESLNVR